MTKVELVGVLNVTPDSFSDGNKFLSPDAAIDQTKELFRSGASIVDIGAESTRPNALIVGTDEEWQRLLPVLDQVATQFPGKLSVDTRHPDIVDRLTARFGNDFILNDVTGFNDPQMRKTVASKGLRCIVSHLPRRYGTDIQAAHKGPLEDNEERVKSELTTRYEELVDAGVSPQDIILDPGIGFGKTPELNWRLLRFSELMPGFNIMIGYSRKRFLGDRRFDLDRNLEAGRIAITAGARYLRVHDVAGHKSLLDV